ncbi:hypothetical protein P3L10_028472 [Capsicum annuum]
MFLVEYCSELAILSFWPNKSGSLSLLDSGPYATFVGVYDGHGGPETSRVCS